MLVKKEGAPQKKSYFNISLQYLQYLNKDKLPIGAKQLRKKEDRETDKQTISLSENSEDQINMQSDGQTAQYDKVCNITQLK